MGWGGFAASEKPVPHGGSPLLGDHATSSRRSRCACAQGTMHSGHVVEKRAGVAVASITIRRQHQQLCISSSTSLLGHCFSQSWPENFPGVPMGMEKAGCESVVVRGTSLISSAYLRPPSDLMSQAFACSRRRPCSCLLPPSLGPVLRVQLPQEFPPREGPVESVMEAWVLSSAGHHLFQGLAVEVPGDLVLMFLLPFTL